MMSLRWCDLSRLSPEVQVQQAFYPPGYAFPLHDHDFAEVFLIAAGEARHRGLSGEIPAPEGSCGCVPPGLRHGLAAGGRRSCTLINIAFPVTLLRRILREHPELGPWWSDRWPPPQILLGDADRRAVLDWAERLRHPAASRLDVHAFLLDLGSRLERPQREAAGPTPPRWLAEVIEAAATPEGFAEGVGAYARLSGRSGAHIARLIRRHYGLTANQLVNRRRMDHAALLLAHGTRPITEVMQACGFSAPAQFYRRFCERFGMPPAAYRAQAGRAV